MTSVTGLEGRTALITGARGALGGAAVKVFTEAGATICRQDKSDLASSAAWFDVTDTAQAIEAVDEVIRAYGKIDILLNIVGTWAPQPHVKDIEDSTVEKLMKVNFNSALIMSRAVLPCMIEQGWGRIVNVGAKQALKGTAGNSAYSASKAAVIALTQSIAEEGAPHGVTCNVVLPSTIDTPNNRAGMPKADFSRWVKPEHIAEAMAFLCTESGGSINGATVPVWNRS